MFSSPSEIPILLKEKKTKTETKTLFFLPRRKRSEEAKKEDTLIVKVLGRLARPAPGQLPCQAASSTAQSRVTRQRTRWVLWTILIIGSKSQMGGGGKEKKSTILLLFDYRTFAKELISTSAKSLENTNTGFSHSFWVLRGRAGIKGTKK